MKTLKITRKLRYYLKKPLGRLIPLEHMGNIELLKEVLKKEKPVKLISVGDIVTDSLIKNNIEPDLYIVDGRTLRGEFNSQPARACSIKVINPPGTINSSVWMVIGSCLEKEDKIGIFVEGEEDLLVLPSVILAPLGAVVIYGQPNKGVVIVKVDQEIKNKVQKILCLMEEVVNGQGF
ncbi:MAG: DUF359 domain-containing protein [Candidatus Odinarchaeota archaeon]